MKIVHHITFLILFVFAFSWKCCPVYCAESNDDIIIRHEDYPLRLGLSVEFSVVSSLEQMNKTRIKHIYSDGVEIGDKKFIKRVISLPGGQQNTFYFFRSDEGIVRVPAMTSSEESLLLKLPLSVGKSWIQKDYIGSRVFETKKSAETVETITTPLGELKCIKVRQSKAGGKFGDEDSFLWVTKEYGIVKIELNKKTKNDTITKTVITISRFEDRKARENKKRED